MECRRYTINCVDLMSDFVFTHFSLGFQFSVFSRRVHFTFHDNKSSTTCVERDSICIENWLWAVNRENVLLSHSIINLTKTNKKRQQSFKFHKTGFVPIAIDFRSQTKACFLFHYFASFSIKKEIFLSLGWWIAMNLKPWARLTVKYELVTGNQFLFSF